MRTSRKLYSGSVACTLVLLSLVLAGTGHLTTIEADTSQVRQLFRNLIGNPLKVHRPGDPPVVRSENDRLCDPINGRKNTDRERGGHEPAKTLYVWAGDQARVAPDFLAVINFDEDSDDYGKVIGTVPVPPPGNVGNEAHHC